MNDLKYWVDSIEQGKYWHCQCEFIALLFDETKFCNGGKHYHYYSLIHFVDGNYNYYSKQHEHYWADSIDNYSLLLKTSSGEIIRDVRVIELYTLRGERVKRIPSTMNSENGLNWHSNVK